MKKEWYIIEYEQKTYLHNKTLLKKIFDKSGDHRHCELCWNRISVEVDDANFGYYDCDSGSWICETCFGDFKELFNWKSDSNT